MSPTSVTFESPVTPLDEDELVLVQPKLVFANERTFLAYMHAMLLLSGVALGMLNFGSKEGLISAFIFCVLSIATMFYALWTYLSRARLIQAGVEECFSNRLGPSLLILAFLITIAINFTFRFSEV